MVYNNLIHAIINLRKRQLERGTIKNMIIRCVYTSTVQVCFLFDIFILLSDEQTNNIHILKTIAAVRNADDRSRKRNSRLK